ncbi:MAG: acyltransferase family protein, partial [Clostridia bacterium]
GAVYVLQKCGRILLLYVIWSAVYIIYGHMAFGNPWPTSSKLLTECLMQGSACYHLYYIVLLVQIYIFIALISHLPKIQLQPRLWQPASAIAVQQILFFAFIYLIVYRFWFFNTALLIIFYCVPIAYGLMLASDAEETFRIFRRYRLLFGAALLLASAALAGLFTYGGQLFGERFVLRSFCECLSRSVLCFGGIPLMFLMSEKLKSIKPLELLGKHSLGIYFAHPLILFAIDKKAAFNQGTPLLLLWGMAVKLGALAVFSLIYSALAEKLKRNTLLKNSI